MSIDIANCPFCGAKASVQTQFGVDHWVQCESDTCASTNGKTTASRRHAIDSWNRRATPQAPTPAAAWAVESNIGTGVRAFVKFFTDEAEADRFAARHQAAYSGAERVKVPLYRAAPLPRQAAVRDETIAGSQNPAAWIDQFGNAFPLGAYSPTGKPNYQDAHKRGWEPLFRATTEKDKS